MKRILISLLTLSVFSTAQAEKLSEEQFNSKVRAFTTILKDANTKYEQALAANNRKDGIYQYCRGLNVYHKSIKMATENPQISQSLEIQEIMQDTLQNHLRPIKAMGLTEEQFCELEGKL